MNILRVNFYCELSKKNSTGKCPIWVRSRHNSEKLIRRSTGFMCDSGELVNGVMRVKDQVLKNRLIELHNSLQTSYKRLSETNPASTLADSWDVVFGNGKGDVPRSTKVRDWVQHYIDNSPNATSYTRGAKLLNVHLKAAHNLTFDQLTQTRIDSLCKTMADEGKASNTILKTLKFIKQVAKIAQDEGLKVGSLKFKAPKSYHRRARTEVRLTFPELQKIEQVEFDDELMNEARDLFLLQSYTGLRHVDVIRLSQEHINRKKNFLSIRQQKTGADVHVTLNQFSKAIIERYWNKIETNSAPLFSSFKQQYYNRAIKNVARSAGLKDIVKQVSFKGPKEVVEMLEKWKTIKSHTGRRTYARLLSTAGLEESIIADELGHSVTSVTRGYIGSHEHLQRIKLVQAAWNKLERNEKRAVMNVA